MTAATASPSGKPPLQRPSPPQKSMPDGQPKVRGGSCLGLSCFGGSPVADSSAGHPVARPRTAPWLTWSRSRKKKKTVPVDSSATELIPEQVVAGDHHPPQEAGEDEAAGKGRAHGAEEEEEPGKQHRRCTAPTKTAPAAELASQSFFWRFRKGNKDGGGSKTQLSGSRRNLQLSASASNHGQRQQSPHLPSISFKYDARRGAPPNLQSKQARAAPRTAPPPAAGCSLSSPPPAASPARSKPPPSLAGTASRLGCTRSNQKFQEPSSSLSSSVPAVGRNDQVLGLSVMAVVLVMMVLFGRVSAVVFTCLWLYCLPWVRATMTESQGGGNKSATAVDFDSDEYKKKVVLEGLLQRNGRRPPVAGSP